MKRVLWGTILIFALPLTAFAGGDGREYKSYRQQNYPASRSFSVIEGATDGRSITVISQQAVSKKPDYALFYVHLVSKGESKVQAVQNHTDRIKKALSLFEKLKIEGASIEEASPIGFEQAARRKDSLEKNIFSNPPNNIIFTASYAIKVTQLNNLPAIFTQIAQSDLFLSIPSIIFKASNEMELSLEAQKQAVTQARNQAKTYVDALGQTTLKEVQYFTNYDVEMSDVVSVERLEASDVYRLSAPDALHFSARVKITWGIEPPPVSLPVSALDEKKPVQPCNGDNIKLCISCSP